MEDDDVAIVEEEGPCRGKIAGVEVRERVIIEFILFRRLSVNRGDLEDIRDVTVGRAAAGQGGHGGTFVFRSVGRHRRRVVSEEQNEGPRKR